MKKLIFTLFCGVLYLGQIQAQLGLRIGANMANYSVNDDIEYKAKLGFSAGIFYKLKAGESITIQPELNYVQQGSKLEEGELKYTLFANYLQVPVLLKYGFGNMEKTNFFVQAGPYFGIGIGKIKNEECLGNECDTQEEDFGDDTLKTSDFGLNLGVGININSKISVDFRYGLGLAEIDGDDEIKAKNTAINFGVGYTF